MDQPDLFAPARPAPAPRPPNLPYIRKRLGAVLRLARNAEILPWSEVEADRLTEHVPALARALPAEEAAAICAEFAAELRRLRPAAA
jgi:hypothetical protein